MVRNWDISGVGYTFIVVAASRGPVAVGESHSKQPHRPALTRRRCLVLLMLRAQFWFQASPKHASAFKGHSDWVRGAALPCQTVVVLSCHHHFFFRVWLQVNDIALCENVGVMASVSPCSACCAAARPFLP